MQMSFYKPVDGWSGDYIPFYHDGKFRLFYLLDRHMPRGHLDGIAWHLVETEDFVHFDPKGLVIPFGTEEEQDRCVYTGSIIKAGECFHIFYTGHNPFLREKGLPEQKIMHAVSHDLLNWQKLPEHTFAAPGGYEMHDWRDPFVFYDGETGIYHMLVAARLNCGPEPRRGCTGHLTSLDLTTWRLEKPFWVPQSYFTHECPDLFRMGDWYYLIFSEFSDLNRTRYVMSRNINGPWIVPEHDVFDTRAYYAAKSCSDGQRRYLFGWLASREDETDFSPFRWAGSLVVHELYALENGELACREPQSITQSWQAGEAVNFTDSPLQGGADISMQGGMGVAYASAVLPKKFRFEADICFERGTHDFGVLLRADTQNDTGYALSFCPSAHRIEFFIRPRLNYKNFNDEGLNRVFDMTPGKPFHLSITVDGDSMVSYIDRKIAFSTRMCNLHSEGLGVYSLNGGLQIRNARLSTRQG